MGGGGKHGGQMSIIFHHAKLQKYPVFSQNTSDDSLLRESQDGLITNNYKQQSTKAFA